jgi:LysR family nod box-dependent transcriptional activator
MNLGQIDLHLLVALDALLRERNVTRAGDCIGYSQPAMSNALKRLRAMFGDELLVRVGRNYHLTPVAQELGPSVQEILHLIDQTVKRRADFDSLADQRTFRIAATDYAEYVFLQPLIQKIASEAPGISLELTAVHGRPTVRQLESGELDMGIWPLAPCESTLVRQRLHEDRWVCATWSGLEGLGDTLSLRQFLALPFAGFSASRRENGASDALVSLPEGTRTRITLEDDFQRLFHLRGTNFVTLTGAALARKLADVAGLCVFEPPFETPPLISAMYWHPRCTTDPAHRWLRDQVLQIASHL